MRSHGHALLSLVLAAVLVLAVPPPVHPAVVVAVVLAVGVGIDVDHFALALLARGTLEPVRRLMRRPRILLLDQESIFADDEVTAPGRLLSHVVLGGAAVAAVGTVSLYWTLVVGSTVYLHVLADLYADLGTWDTTA